MKQKWSTVFETASKAQGLEEKLYQEIMREQRLHLKRLGEKEKTMGHYAHRASSIKMKNAKEIVTHPLNSRDRRWEDVANILYSQSIDLDAVKIRQAERQRTRDFKPEEKPKKQKQSAAKAKPIKKDLQKQEIPWKLRRALLKHSAEEYKLREKRVLESRK